MEKSASVSPSQNFVKWEEVVVSGDKGGREIHYFLKRKDGTSNLAIVGKERSLRHMSYKFTSPNSALDAITPSSFRLKLKSRREVINWLDYAISDSTLRGTLLPRLPSNSAKGCDPHMKKSKGSQLQKVGHYTKEFLWLGSSLTCQKRWEHYQSFRHNGVKISVNDFVYVFAEGDRLLVAYIEDMYEDSSGNKMVVVRWFHKIDEVGIVLPHNSNDREIFFSLCLQDLQFECIDGLATVLNPHHFWVFSNHATTYLRFEPFMCSGLFENDAVQPFDVTILKGYSKQNIFRHANAPAIDGLKLRRRHNKFPRIPHFRNLNMQNPGEYLTVGREVEILCQDSGIRGCWFRAEIIKKRGDWMKIRYNDLQDAEDETQSVEEWVSASRVESSDSLGFRMRGRRAVRPSREANTGKVSCVMVAGSVVDVWWYDGWWEGIVVEKVSDEQFLVYFPGERRNSVFSGGELRHSEEWVRDRWVNVRNRPDVVRRLEASSRVGDLKWDPAKKRPRTARRWRSRKMRSAGNERSLKTIKIVGPRVYDFCCVAKSGREELKYMRDSSVFSPRVALPPLTSLVMSM